MYYFFDKSGKSNLEGKNKINYIIIFYCCII